MQNKINRGGRIELASRCQARKKPSLMERSPPAPTSQCTTGPVDGVRLFAGEERSRPGGAGTTAIHVGLE